MTAGNDIANGCASSLTEMPSCRPSRASSARRVGSASAAKVRSRASSLYLTIWFSIAARRFPSRGLADGPLVQPGSRQSFDQAPLGAVPGVKLNETKVEAVIRALPKRKLA
jgi:hypothetical protein